MAAIADLQLQLAVTSDEGALAGTYPSRVRWSPGVGNGQRQTVTLAAGDNTLTPPTGAKAALLILGEATELTLKGADGDDGIALTPSSAPVGFDCFLPLASVTTFVVENGEATSQSIEVWYL